jgi:hypothetical protein
VRLLFFDGARARWIRLYVSTVDRLNSSTIRIAVEHLQPRTARDEHCLRNCSPAIQVEVDTTYSMRKACLKLINITTYRPCIDRSTGMSHLSSNPFAHRIVPRSFTPPGYFLTTVFECAANRSLYVALMAIDMRWFF